MAEHNSTTFAHMLEEYGSERAFNAQLDDYFFSVIVCSMPCPLPIEKLIKLPLYAT